MAASDALKAAIAAQNLRQSQVCKASGLSAADLSRMCHGHRQPTARRLAKLQAAGIDPRPILAAMLPQPEPNEPLARQEPTT